MGRKILSLMAFTVLASFPLQGKAGILASAENFAVLGNSVVSGVDSQFLLCHLLREQPAQVRCHSIFPSRDGQHDPHRTLLLPEF